MACKDKRKVWVDVKGHERRVLKCVNKPKKSIPNKLKVKLPGIEKRRARPPRQARPPRSPPRSPPRGRIHISPPRATPPRFSATPPPEPSATPPPKRISPHRKTPSKQLGVSLKRLTPHKKRVKPTYDDEPLNDIRRIREFKVRPARKYASTWPGYW